MALTVGTIDIETLTGTGLSFALFDGLGMKAYIQSFDTPPPPPLPPIVLSDDQKQQMADYCIALASVFIGHITANAVVAVTVHTTDAALQRTPNPNNPTTDTLGPGTNKTLNGTVA